MTDLMKENSRLREQNEQLVSLVDDVMREMEKSVDFWRSMYMTLWTGLPTDTGEWPVMKEP